MSSQHQLQMERQLRVLKFMYSKHLLCPRTLELDILRVEKSQPHKINAKELAPLDQDHFMGLAATNSCIDETRISGESVVLDIGSGLGGPARYISHRTGCRVLGVEIQRDRLLASMKLTRMVGLDGRVQFVHADIAAVPLPRRRFTHAIAFLSILHILDKPSFLQHLREFLVEGGQLYIEDYYQNRAVAAADSTMLLRTVSCPNLMRLQHYLQCLDGAGISVTATSDMTHVWRQLVDQRHQDLTVNRASYVRAYGEKATERAAQFAAGVLKLFQSGVIGGIRIIGERRRRSVAPSERSLAATAV